MKMTQEATTSEEKSSRSYWGFVLWPVLLAVALATPFVAGCSYEKNGSSQARHPGARLTAAEAIRIACETAQREGRNLDKYKVPQAQYELVQKGSPSIVFEKTWIVFFEGRELRFGNHFSVWVDDRTGKAGLSPGL